MQNHVGMSLVMGCNLDGWNRYFIKVQRQTVPWNKRRCQSYHFFQSKSENISNFQRVRILIFSWGIKLHCVECF